MLSHEELMKVAEDYARTHYGEVHGDDYELGKVVELSDPPGALFAVVYPPAAELTGDGGFFVARRDGRVTQLGSGDLMTLFDPADPQNENIFTQGLRDILMSRGGDPDAAV